MSTPENIRYHAAGHLAAAALLAKAGELKASGILLTEVVSYLESRSVDCPSPLRMSLSEYAKSPATHMADILAIEALFVHPANTALEESGVIIGSDK